MICLKNPDESDGIVGSEIGHNENVSEVRGRGKHCIPRIITATTNIWHIDLNLICIFDGVKMAAY